MAINNLFKVDIVLISTLGPGENYTISSSTGSPLARLFVFHLAKDNDIHSVNLSQSIDLSRSNFIQTKQNGYSEKELNEERKNNKREDFKTCETNKTQSFLYYNVFEQVTNFWSGFKSCKSFL